MILIFVKLMFCLKRENLQKCESYQFSHESVLREERLFLQKEKNTTVLPKITGKMKVVSYGLVLTRVIEQMEAVRLNTVKLERRVVTGMQ